MVYCRMTVYGYVQYIVKLKGPSSRLDRSESDTVAEAWVIFFYLKFLKHFKAIKKKLGLSMVQLSRTDIIWPDSPFKGECN